jgi:hypothetical protein
VRARRPVVETCRLGDAALAEEPADLGGRVRKAARLSLDGDEAEAEHLEAELAAHLLEQAHGAVAAVAEVEVGADDHQPRAEALDEHLSDEVLGGLLTARLVEGEDHGAIEISRRAEELDLLLERREQLGRALRPHDLGRVAVEGEADGFQAARVRQLAHEAQHRLVPEVHAVVGADRDRAAAPAPRDVLERDHFHHALASWGATTTAGRNAAPRRS